MRGVFDPLPHGCNLDGGRRDRPRGEERREFSQDSIAAGRTDPTILELVQAEGVTDRLSAGEADGVSHEVLIGSRGRCP